jgi:hypothetical protein
MALDLSKLVIPTQHGNATVQQERPKAKYWLNIGYTVSTPNGDTFVSTPYGLALDTMTKCKESSSNEQFSMLQQAKNGLLDQLLEGCANIPAGEDILLGTLPNGLEIRIRHAKDEAVPTSGVNPFMKKLF